eukprot:5631280-Amphidinium_carterae.1
MGILHAPGRHGMRLANSKTAWCRHLVCFFQSTAMRSCLRARLFGSSTIPCCRHEGATSTPIGGFRALVVLPVISAVPRQTCDAELDANGASAETSRIQIRASWELEGVQ